MVGTELLLEVGAVAHGGHCVARHEGRAVFVRHTLPGERVRALVTEGRERDSFWRADAVEVLRAASSRVEPPCPWSGPGRCGGCDWQHAALPAQRELKAAVVREQLARLAGLDVTVVVEAVPVPGSEAGGEADEGGTRGTGGLEGTDGLGWRTRVGLHVDAGGRAGLLAHRSHAVVPVSHCPVTHPLLRMEEVLAQAWPGSTRVDVVGAPSTGQRLVLADRVGAREQWVDERAAGRDWTVAAGGFWQGHAGAADTLVDAVLEALAPRPGERVLDLYAGVGLFAGALATVVGPGGEVLAVEGDELGVAGAEANLADLPWARVLRADVAEALAGLSGVSGWSGGPGEEQPGVDLVVLDPPRTGAGRVVVGAIAARSPRAVAYVACDPAALARDVAFFAGHGYHLGSLRAFDLFPMTQHVECVAVLTRGDAPG